MQRSESFFNANSLTDPITIPEGPAENLNSFETPISYPQERHKIGFIWLNAADAHLVFNVANNLKTDALTMHC